MPLRRGQPGGLPRHGHQHQGGAGRQLQAFPLQAGRGALHPHRTRAGACDVPRQRRHGGHHGGLRRVRQPVLPRDVLRQRGGGHPVDRPRHGTAHRLSRQHHALRHEPVRDDQRAHQRRRAADLPRPGQADRVLRTRRASDGGAAHQAARGVRPRNDQGAGLLPGHRELLALLRRPRRRDAPLLPDRLFPEGLPDGRGREPRHPAAGPRHVRRRPRPQGEPRGVRLPPPGGQGQPPVDLLGVRTVAGHVDLRERHARGLRADEERGRDRRTADPPHRAGGPAVRGARDAEPDRRPDRTRCS